MALLGREFIAVPDDRKGQIVFKWPDITIRRFTRAIVNADEMALFVNTGQVVQTMGPGRHQIDANELPGLGAVIDSITGGNAYRAELYFVGTREYTGFKFGGRVDDVQDPRTGLVVTLRVFGDYALRVADPVRLVTNMTATVDVTDNERIAGWVSDQLLKVLRTHVTTQIIRNGWPILGLMAYSAEIEQATIDAANGQLVAYGVQLTRMGNFDVNLSPEDEKQLKQLAKDTSYSQLAGGFQNYAAAEMALRAVPGWTGRSSAPGSGWRARWGRSRSPTSRRRARPPSRRPPSRACHPTATAVPAVSSTAARPSRRGARRPSRPRPARCARPARRRTRRARSSAWAAVRRSRPPSRTARSAAPSSRPARTSAPAAAPASAADAAAASPPPSLLQPQEKCPAWQTHDLLRQMPATGFSVRTWCSGS
jgi:membrane protease subunit (stomatin/prohibitin family)